MGIGKGSNRRSKPNGICKTQNVARDVSRIDPTRTGQLRQTYGRALVARLNRLKGDVYTLIHDKDILGKRPIEHNPFAHNAAYTYASTQVDIEDLEFLKAFDKFQDMMDHKDVVRFEVIPHITVRYGLHQHGGTAEAVTAIVGGSGEIVVSFGQLSVFEITKDGVDMDVLKVEINSPDLKELNARLGFLPNTQTYEYSPHMTVAYLYRGAGKKYTGDMTGITGCIMKFNKVKYSNKEGDKKEVLVTPVSNTSWMNKEFTEQLDLFKDWLKQRFNDHLIGADEEIAWSKMGLAAYQRGVLRAYDEVTKKLKALSAQNREQSSVYAGRRLQFMKDTLNKSVGGGTLKLLSKRAFSDVSGVVEALTTTMVRTFTDGMISNKDTKDIAGQLIRDIERVAVKRLKLVAAQDIVRTYNEAKLDAYTALGVKEVAVNVEWSSGTQRTCRVCSDLSTATFSIPDARGQLPVHVGCSCAWKMVGTPQEQTTRISSPTVILNHECDDCINSFSKALESSGITPGTVN